ncbi:hypothetical protein H6504_01775 [Candidatus Woesearchaeota archaeon]|nr:hypothetical protein [Candidatus Woesearchaeota archaeon]
MEICFNSFKDWLEHLTQQRILLFYIVVIIPVLVLFIGRRKDFLLANPLLILLLAFGIIGGYYFRIGKIAKIKTNKNIISILGAVYRIEDITHVSLYANKAKISVSNYKKREFEIHNLKSKEVTDLKEYFKSKNIKIK